MLVSCECAGKGYNQYAVGNGLALHHLAFREVSSRMPLLARTVMCGHLSEFVHTYGACNCYVEAVAFTPCVLWRGVSTLHFPDRHVVPKKNGLGMKYYIR